MKNITKSIENAFDGDLQDDAKQIMYAALKNPTLLDKVIGKIIGETDGVDI